MANLVCELDWAEEYPAASITLVLDASVRVLQKGSASVARVKKIYPLLVERHHPIWCGPK